MVNELLIQTLKEMNPLSPKFRSVSVTKEEEEQVKAIYKRSSQIRRLNLGHMANQLERKHKTLLDRHDKYRENSWKIESANAIREIGYFPIILPRMDWADINGTTVSFCPLSSSTRDGYLGMPKALYNVQLRKFKGYVPDFIIDRLITEGNKCVDYSILFVGSRSDAKRMIRETPRPPIVDPVLLGYPVLERVWWFNGVQYDSNTEAQKQRTIFMEEFEKNNQLITPHAVIPDVRDQIQRSRIPAVLGMWSDDLEEIELALIS